jgi:hypothetical protein
VGVEVVREGDSAVVRCRRMLEPPLLIGLDALEVPRSLPALLLLTRRTLPRTLDSELALTLLRRLHAMVAGAPTAWRVSLSDGDVAIELTPANELEIETARSLTEAMAEAMLDITRGARRTPWKHALIEAWSNAAKELGAELDADTLTMTLARGGNLARAQVRISGDRVVTEVRIAVADAAALSSSPSDARTRLEGLGCSVSERDGALAIERPGLIASAEVLGEVLALAFQLASNSETARGPYR